MEAPPAIADAAGRRSRTQLPRRSRFSIVWTRSASTPTPAATFDSATCDSALPRNARSFRVLMARSVASVQDLHRYRKDLTPALLAQQAATAA